MTQFAPAERTSKEEIKRKLADISSKPLLAPVLDAIPDICLVVNKERQIVFANQAMMDFMGVTDRASVCGLRPGEALHCVHAGESQDGCGTTEFCSTCGAVRALMTSGAGTGDVQECRIMGRDGREMMDLRVYARPIMIDEEHYTVFTVTDISNEKRRRALERVFFHDILNTAGAIRGFCELLMRKSLDEADKLQGRIQLLSRRLVEEIEAQRALTAAERGELSTKQEDVQATDIMRQVVSLYADLPFSVKRDICLDPRSTTVTFRSDRSLLSRVLANLLKNAIEASREGEQVTIGAGQDGDRVKFWVRNTAEMPRPVQLQVFQRSFSTKGQGRGLGAYSAKLLTKCYLKGTISFVSEPETGTTFTVTYPLALG
jgi:signal transduction histidine kinase